MVEYKKIFYLQSNFKNKQNRDYELVVIGVV